MVYYLHQNIQELQEVNHISYAIEPQQNRFSNQFDTHSRRLDPGIFLVIRGVWHIFSPLLAPFVQIIIVYRNHFRYLRFTFNKLQSQVLTRMPGDVAMEQPSSSAMVSEQLERKKRTTRIYSPWIVCLKRNYKVPIPWHVGSITAWRVFQVQLNSNRVIYPFALRENMEIMAM